MYFTLVIESYFKSEKCFFFDNKSRFIITVEEGVKGSGIGVGGGAGGDKNQ